MTPKSGSTLRVVSLGPRWLVKKLNHYRNLPAFFAPCVNLARGMLNGRRATPPTLTNLGYSEKH